MQSSAKNLREPFPMRQDINRPLDTIPTHPIIGPDGKDKFPGFEIRSVMPRLKFDTINNSRACYLMGSMFFYAVAVVLSVSVPEALHTKWKESEVSISPSALFQTALETELDKTNRHLVYWSTRALNAEKKLKMIENLIAAKDKDVKKFLLFESDS